MKVFDTVPVKVPDKNVFDLSHDVKATYNFDKIYPILCQPVYPGDTWNCRAEVFMRSMPLLAPVMHNVDLRVYFFFYPNRLGMNENKKRDWQTYITGGETGDVDVTLPYFTYREVYDAEPENIKHGSLLDHMGFPTVDDPSGQQDYVNVVTRINALPFRAYADVWNEYFRNQNLQNAIEFSHDAGEIDQDDYSNLFVFRKKCWEKDYFTSCLPWEQRGVAMTLPISGQIEATGTMDVTVSDAQLLGSDVSNGISKVSNSGSSFSVLGYDSTQGAAGAAVDLKGTAVAGDNLHFTGLQIGTINEFRYCLRLQQWMENNARCGSRYIEQLFAHFGVKSSDARLQRPELLGGGKIPLLFTDVEQTSFGEGTSDDVLGDLAGKGTLYGKTSGFKKYFEEHGILLGLLVITPRTSYSQGIPRAWTALHRTDWYFPEFAHLGEQAVLNKEIYFNPIEEPVIGHMPDDVFGYQGRFTELRYIPSTFHGEMRSDLKYWHMGRIFNELPVLNSDFVTARTDARCFALADVVESGYDPFVAQIHLDIKAVRPLPKYAVPTL